MSAAQSTKKLSWLIIQQGKGTFFLVSCQELTILVISKGRCENSLWISKYHPEQFTKAVSIRQKRLWHLAGCRRKIMLLNSEFSFKSVLFLQNVDWNKNCPSQAPRDSVHLDLFVGSLPGRWILLFGVAVSASATFWKLGENSRWGRTSPSCQGVLCPHL